MSRPEPTPTHGPLARRDGEPVFGEAWQAQVMALVFTLMERGAFSNVQWSDALGVELKASSARGDPDSPTTYYRAAQAALERLLSGDGQVCEADLAERTEAWRRAYLNTPHGQPVALSAASASSPDLDIE